MTSKGSRRLYGKEAIRKFQILQKKKNLREAEYPSLYLV